MSVQKKKKKKAKKENAIKVILMTDEDTTEEEDLDEDDEEESGMYLDKEDALLIYNNALKEYKPTEDEDVLHSTLFEEFEEILVVNYGVKLPGFEDFNAEDD
jgi:hypothetical protein